MNATRSKKFRHAATAIYSKFKEQIDQACRDKFDMLNRHGNPQHRRINPRRQLKRMIKRNKLA